MKKAFLETSAINKFFNHGMRGEQLRGFLENKSLSPVIGSFTTFELAKTFLTDNAIEKVKGFFQLIKDLNPEFSYRDDELLVMESRKIKYNLDIIPIINSERLVDLNVRINNFSQGAIDNLLEGFIESKQENMNNARLLWSPQNYNDKISEFNSFIEYRDSFLKECNINYLKYRDHLKDFLKNTAEIKLHNHHILKLLKGIHSYPALRTHFYSHLFLNFISRSHPPAKDKISDAMQLTEAAYFPIFISGDERHLKYANDINPDIQLISTKNLGIN